jgi:phosphonoacetate hydrolase
MPSSLTVNGRPYGVPDRPVVVISLDGCADEYLDAAMTRGRMPAIREMSRRGYRGLARAALPSFTNVNNASIVTGVPPSVHGISGNFFLDPDTGAEVMMNSAGFMRAGTLLAAAAAAGRRVALVTAKEKLRDLLSARLQGMAFSAEKANEAREDTHGIGGVESLVGRPTPSIYSAEASLFVLAAGAALLEAGRADFLYLSTTDYMHHRYGPCDEEAVEFCASLDEEIGRVLETGALVAITADHGMNAKQALDGRPNVIYLEPLLEDRFGPGVRVILPITDPYVLHHGALGSLAMVYLPDPSTVERAREWTLALPGITEVHDRRTAAVKLELPADRIGDLVVLSGRDVVIGRTPEYHDLSALQAGLRSHGGRYEEMVPLLVSAPLNDRYRARADADPRNFDVFDFVLNGLA